MKSKKLRKILAAAFALSLALGGGFLVAKSVQPSTEVVLAEDEEPVDPVDDEEPVDPVDDEEPTDSEDEGDTPIDSGSDVEEPSETSDGSAKPDQAVEPEATEEAQEDLTTSVLKALWQAFVEAIKDLIRHIKMWFGIK